jgi:DNA-binding XRE family transcriptional regulator
MSKTSRATGRRKHDGVLMSPPVAEDDRFGDIRGLIAEMDDVPDARAGAARVLEEIAGAQAEHALGLQMLRATFGLTQTELAGALGISQANVAQTEHRGDMLVSTLRRYVETITGGELRLLVTVPGRAPLEFNLIEVESSDAPSDRPRRRGNDASATAKRSAAARVAGAGNVERTAPR